MTNRQLYMAELRAAIGRLCVGYDEISLATIAEQLPTQLAGELPGRVTLAKAITGMGWTKLQRPGSAARYRRPKESAR